MASHDADGVSRAFETARRRRSELHDAMVEVEQAISSPAPGRVQVWAADVAKALTHLRDAFDGHILATEAQGGLYEEILENSPRLSGQVQRLRDEHPVIAARIVGQLAVVSDVSPDELPLDQIRDDVQRVLGQVVRHRQRGADLVWEAYDLDIGGAG